MKTANPLFKSLLLSGAAMSLAAMPAIAHAQTANNTADENNEVIDDEDGVVDSNAIVVTAGKRETTLQELPVAVSVTSADTIEQAQIRDLIDLQSVVPSLRVDQLQSSANTNFVIRGFGNGANNPGIEPSVGVFIDGVYRSRSAAQIGDLPNIQRIEVLRGPQSTLFGKNASAGVISIVTQEPQFQFGGSISGTYGNYDTRIVKGDVTGPITDTIAFALSGNINKRDGYARDLNLGIDFNNRDRWGVRGQILIEPTDALKIRLIGDYDNIDENCCIAANIVAGPTIAVTNLLAGGRSVDAENPFSYNVYNNFPSANKIENYGGSAQVDYEAGALTFTSITAYREVRSFTNQDSDFTSADLIGENSADVAINTFTQELRAASDFDGPLNFLLGGYYFNEKIDISNRLLFGTQFRPYGDLLIRGATGGALGVSLTSSPTPPPPPVGLEETFGAFDGNPAQYIGSFFRSGDGFFENYSFKDEAYSIFGQVDFNITDKLTITGGLNYTDDSKRVSSDVVSTDVFSRINLDAPQYAPFRNGLLVQGGIAQTVGQALGLGRPATAGEIGAFAGANPAAFGQIRAGAQAFANANQNNPAANPLGPLRAFQFLPPFLNFPNAVEDGRTNDDKLTYTARANYEFNDHINVYLTYATGFKASSFNLSRDSRPLASDLPAIRAAGLATPNLTSGTRFAGPENATVYEAGLKASFSKVAFNLAVFQQEIQGFQSNIFTGTGFQLVNAGKQSTFGIEFDGTVTPVDPLTIFLAVTYLDPVYDSFPNSGVFDTNGNRVNLTGATPSGIPPISLSTGATFTQNIGSAQLILRGDYQYESEAQIVDNVPGVTQQKNLFNAAVTLKLANGLELSAYGRNLTNDEYLISVFPSVAQSGSFSGYPNQPRTYGGSVRFKF